MMRRLRRSVVKSVGITGERKLKQKLILAFKTLISIPVGIVGLCLALAVAVIVFRGDFLEDFVRDAITGNTPAEDLAELIAEAEEKATEREAEDDAQSVAVIPENANVYNSLLQEWRELSLNSKGEFDALIDYHAHTEEYMQDLVENSVSPASRCGRDRIIIGDLQSHDLHRRLHRALWCRDTLVGEWFIVAHENYQSGTLAMRVPWLTYTIAFREDGAYEWSEDLRRLWGWPESKNMKYSTEWRIDSTTSLHREPVCSRRVVYWSIGEDADSHYFVSWKIDDKEHAQLIMKVLGPNEIEVRMIELTRPPAPSPLPSSSWNLGCGYRTSEFTLVRRAESE